MNPSATKLIANICIRQEVINAPLGDKRRQSRFAKIVESLSEKPDVSIPNAMKTEAENEAYYRLMRNDAVGHFDLLQPHFESTKERCEVLKTVLVAHDTTEFAFDIHDEFEREHLARLSSRRQGFLWHASLAISADSLHAPMGLIASRPFVHASQISEPATIEMWRGINGIIDKNEQHRWMDGVEAVMQHLENVSKVIHVMDREGDDYCTLFPMNTSGYSYVVRMVGDRSVCDGPLRKDRTSLSELLEKASWLADERTVSLSARVAKKADPAHPVRRARTTTLKIRATTVELRRPDSVPADQAPARFTANVVEALEISPPKGEAPVRWLLITDQPIETADDCWQIVDWYRARWQIEEYFKALKTGTAYTKLQHKQAKTLLNALSAKAIVAWNLLVLRHLGHHAGELPAEAVVNPVQIKVLRALKPKMIGPKPTAAQALSAIAQLGGHLRQNGPPGWQIIGRGWMHLLDVEQGFRLALGGDQEM